MTPDCVNLIDKDDARRRFLALIEHITHARRADADKHLNKVRAADGKERDIRFPRNGAREERLTGSRRANHQDALWNAAAEFLKFLRVTQELDELLYFVFCFLDSGNIAECDFIFVAGEHARFRFAEIESAFPGHADLLAEQEVKHQEEKGDRQKTDHGLGKHVRFSLDRGLDAGRSQFFLQITCETQIDGGPKRNLLGRRRTYSLADISAAQRLSRPSILYHQLERRVFVVNDLFVVQQFDKPVVRHVFDRLHPAAVKEHRHRD